MGTVATIIIFVVSFLAIRYIDTEVRKALMPKNKPQKTVNKFISGRDINITHKYSNEQSIKSICKLRGAALSSVKKIASESESVETLVVQNLDEDPEEPNTIKNPTRTEIGLKRIHIFKCGCCKKEMTSPYIYMPTLDRNYLTKTLKLDIKMDGLRVICNGIDCGYSFNIYHHILHSFQPYEAKVPITLIDWMENNFGDTISYRKFLSEKQNILAPIMDKPVEILEKDPILGITYASVGDFKISTDCKIAWR